MRFRDEEIIEEIVVEQHIRIQAAAYTIYVELTPNNKKPISQEEFNRKFKVNCNIFGNLDSEYYVEE